MLKPTGDFFHAIFTVPDLKRSVAFYRDTLGFKVLFETYDFELNPGSGRLLSIAVLERNDGIAHGMVELFQKPGTKAGTLPPVKLADNNPSFNLGYFALVFQVKDLPAIYREWKANGVNFVNEPNIQVVPGFIKTYSVLMRDVDGNLIELVQPIELLA